MTLALDIGGTSDPRWRGVFCAIRRDIDQHGLAPGARLPPERQLAEDYGVSRHSVRLALSALQAEGLVEIVHGRGLFVAESVIPLSIGPRTRFSENIARLNLKGRRKYLADRVELPASTPVGPWGWTRAAKLWWWRCCRWWTTGRSPWFAISMPCPASKA